MQNAKHFVGLLNADATGLVSLTFGDPLYFCVFVNRRNDIVPFLPGMDSRRSAENKIMAVELVIA